MYLDLDANGDVRICTSRNAVLTSYTLPELVAAYVRRATADHPRLTSVDMAALADALEREAATVRERALEVEA